MTESYDLRRFTVAQDRCYASVVEELSAGRKRSHWMWYIFPQVRGLGESAMSQEYAISSRGEAAAYWEHPVLGMRLDQCTRLVMSVEGRTATQIFSYPDDLKFRSCMTLFDRSVPGADIFRAALAQYFDGLPDRLTVDILGAL